ncbi:MAG: tRNA preQ1(34) S-adenosylmethionine ribosyltransferase-isomerase QueA [Woeseiaceae bacterium]|nr:tRNA preQ1(34) S-adenosylmethionine ribosyltransferase-isomerase QueA [Woeseiaceae bacterium]
MHVSEFDYELPDELIARYPPAVRRGSRLLEVTDGLADRRFAELPQLLCDGDLLVFNDSRVIPARLTGRKSTGGRVEILLERVTATCVALAQVRASKAPKPGAVIRLDGDSDVRVVARHDDLFELQFDADVMTLLGSYGSVPLPPYLGRDAEAVDVERYQTVYARDPGAVAAPTAGLHFDDAMLEETRAAGVRHAFVTLHVGAGTFQPLRNEQIESNRLHSERVHVSDDCAALVNATRRDGGRVIAVGTTAVRSLEAAAVDGRVRAFHGETDLFILPGFRFNAVDAMLTNFHLPQSSLLMLVAAFAGRERILAAYRHAVAERYRFFSYGDCMFLTPEPGA